MKTKKELNVIYYNYVLNCLPDTETLENEFHVIAITDTERLQYLIDQLDKEINYDYNKKRFPNLIDRLADHLQGLPSNFNLEYSYYGILTWLYVWEVIPVIEPGKLREQTENKYIENWFKFWANQILKAAKKNSVNVDKLY